jgi:polyhydroxybutyrate depolymerase
LFGGDHLFGRVARAAALAACCAWGVYCASCKVVGAAPLPACGRAAPTGDSNRSLSSNGVQRRYRLSVPPGYRGEPMPLVFDFHGRGSNGNQQLLLSRMADGAEAHGMLSAHPEGIDKQWNAGFCCGGADDVQFVRDMLEDIGRDYCLDQHRIFATGMSNGGFFALRLACELPDRIAAVASVAGGLTQEPCKPSRPVPVLIIHGTADEVVPYQGRAPRFRAIPETAERWAGLDRCQKTWAESLRRGEVVCKRTACAAGTEVELCTVEGGGHTWPGGLPVPRFGATSRDLNATDYILDFFLRHPAP